MEGLDELLMGNPDMSEPRGAAEGYMPLTDSLTSSRSGALSQVAVAC